MHLKARHENIKKQLLLAERIANTVEVFNVEVDLMGLAIGHHGSTISNARTIEGIEDILIDESQRDKGFCTIKIYAKNAAAAEQARNMLEFIHLPVNVPSNLVGQVIGKNGKNMQDFVDKSGALRVQISDEQRGDPRKYVELLFTGTKEAVENAEIFVKYHLKHLKDMETLRGEVDEINDRLYKMRGSPLAYYNKRFPFGGGRDGRDERTNGGGGGGMGGGGGGNFGNRNRNNGMGMGNAGNNSNRINNNADSAAAASRNNNFGSNRFPPRGRHLAVNSSNSRAATAAASVAQHRPAATAALQNNRNVVVSSAHQSDSGEGEGEEDKQAISGNDAEVSASDSADERNKVVNIPNKVGGGGGGGGSGSGAGNQRPHNTHNQHQQQHQYGGQHGGGGGGRPPYNNNSKQIHRQHPPNQQKSNRRIRADNV